jgi:membrane-bound inhibitor of C-type lysozyme
MSGAGAMRPARQHRHRVALAVAALVVLGACRPAEPEVGPAQAMAAQPVATQPAPDAVPNMDPATATSAVAPDPAHPIETHWQCGERRVAARSDPAARTLTLIHERGQLALPQAGSASGARYADANGNEFWSQGHGATLTLSGTPARECEPVAGRQPG